MSTEPDSLILQLLREMRADMATKDDLAELRSELKSDLHSLRTDVASDILGVQSDIQKARKDLGEQIVGLRRAVVEYHTSVVGHGVLISDLEARLRRVEQHLNLPEVQ